MAEKGITFLGVNEAAADMVKVGHLMAADAERIATEYASKTAEATRGRVPVLTGNLRGSLETLAVSGGQSVGYNEGRAPYAGWIEFGGSRGREAVPAGRYLYPVFTGTENDYVAALEQSAVREVNGYRWHKP
jgi:phage gpG-like protein